MPIGHASVYNRLNVISMPDKAHMRSILDESDEATRGGRRSAWLEQNLTCVVRHSGIAVDHSLILRVSRKQTTN